MRNLSIEIGIYKKRNRYELIIFRDKKIVMHKSYPNRNTLLINLFNWIKNNSP